MSNQQLLQQTNLSSKLFNVYLDTVTTNSLTLNGGLTQSPLNYYEEYTFDSTLVFPQGGVTGISISINGGTPIATTQITGIKITRIGKVVTITIPSILVTSATGLTTQTQLTFISSLPVRFQPPYSLSGPVNMYTFNTYTLPLNSYWTLSTGGIFTIVNGASLALTCGLHDIFSISYEVA